MNVWRVIPAVAALAMTVTVTAQEGPYDRPSELEGVDVRDRIGMKLPLDATFTNHDGETVTIGDYFVPGRPVILTPVWPVSSSASNVVASGRATVPTGSAIWSASRVATAS